MKNNLTFLFRILLIALVAMAGGSAASAAAIAPAAGPAPDFGPNVLIFDPSKATIQSRSTPSSRSRRATSSATSDTPISSSPASTSLDVQVGFYMQVRAWASRPTTSRSPAPCRSKANWMGGNATCNFWRAVENLSVIPTADAASMSGRSRRAPPCGGRTSRAT